MKRSNAFAKMCLFSSHYKTERERERERKKEREGENICSTDHNFLAITTYLISFNDKSPGLIISLLLFVNVRTQV